MEQSKSLVQLQLPFEGAPCSVGSEANSSTLSEPGAVPSKGCRDEDEFLFMQAVCDMNAVWAGRLNPGGGEDACCCGNDGTNIP